MLSMAEPVCVMIRPSAKCAQYTESNDGWLSMLSEGKVRTRRSIM